MFHDSTTFEFTERLESAWPTVRAELDALHGQDFFDWYEPDAHVGAWQICGIHVVDHPESDRLNPDVVRRCPRSVELVKSIPGVNFAAFSLLGPGAIIHPHNDVGPRALRCHLAVKVPPNCLFQVGDEQREWEEGRCLVFDGTSQHAAWNHSDQPRVVLVIEFTPDAAAPE